MTVLVVETSNGGKYKTQFIPCMPGAQLVSSTSGPALPDDASLLCGDRGTWQSESPIPVTDKRDVCDEDDGGFLSLPNLTLRWTQSGTEDDDDNVDDDDDAVFECVAGNVITLCSCWWPWTTHTYSTLYSRVLCLHDHGLHTHTAHSTVVSYLCLHDHGLHTHTAHSTVVSYLSAWPWTTHTYSTLYSRVLPVSAWPRTTHRYSTLYSRVLPVSAWPRTTHTYSTLYCRVLPDSTLYCRVLPVSAWPWTTHTYSTLYSRVLPVSAWHMITKNKKLTVNWQNFMMFNKLR